MEHLAIDLGGKESQICVRSSDGQIVEERRCRTADVACVSGDRPPSRVVVETCSEAFGIADAALSVGHEVRVVPATLVRSLGVGRARLKTDRRDAQVAQRGVVPHRSALGARAQSAGAATQDDVRDAGSLGRGPDEVAQHACGAGCGQRDDAARRRRHHLPRPCPSGLCR